MASSILVDSKTSEPYIPLPEPHSNIRLTPARLSDASAVMASMTDPRIFVFLSGPPHPYLPSHAESWLEEQVDTYESVKGRIADASGAQTRGLFDCTPLRFIREVREDGSEIYLGDVEIGRCQYEDVVHPIQRDQLVAENDAKPLGDPNIIWTIGDHLRPSHHGLGIMTLAIRTLLETWAIPHMGVKHVRAYVLKTNLASKRVFEKLGFKLTATYEDVVPTQGKRETEAGLWVLDCIVDRKV